MTVYADILFLVNFSMDFLTLYLTGHLLHKPLLKLRLIVAALLGSFIGTIYSVTAESGNVISIFIGAILSVIMTCIAFGKYHNAMALIRDSFSVWGAGTLLGGIMTFLLSLGDPVYINPTHSFTPAFAVCLFASIGLIRLFSSSGSKKNAHVTIEALGISHTFEALCDSGSFASEPISGLPVIIVRKSTMADLAAMLEQTECPLRLRMIPLKGIGGDCLLRGFLPDKVIVEGRETAAVVAVQNNSSTFAGYDGVLPSALCKNLQ